jgi:pilus assembly protein CpaF
LKLEHPDLVRLETRQATSKSHPEAEVSMRDLVKNALRMRPDRIIVGEVRGEEAFDMMQAMNTGHEGSLTTVHANHPRDALSRIENMIGMANLNIPVAAIRYQVAAALHVIVQISRQRDGLRRITHITEIIGMEGDTITMNDLFNFVPKGEDEQGNVLGEYKWSGIMPRCVRRVAYYGQLDRMEEALGVKIPLKK